MPHTILSSCTCNELHGDDERIESTRCLLEIDPKRWRFRLFANRTPTTQNTLSPPQLVVGKLPWLCL
eukprot:gene9307-biopygen7680